MSRRVTANLKTMAPECTITKTIDQIPHRIHPFATITWEEKRQSFPQVYTRELLSKEKIVDCLAEIIWN